jgi:methylenetetrahydrofolate reductase (NADPH)
MHETQVNPRSEGVEGGTESDLVRTVVQLARDASIEINVQDMKHVEASRSFLPPGKKIYVSHLPKQSWSETGLACRAVSAAGFDPVPHIPVRLIADSASLDRLLGELVGEARVQEVLLIAGDYPQALGPYSTVVDVLRSGLLNRHGLRRLSVAGHPEGHPNVSLDEIRRAECEKATLAAHAGFDVTFLTQFFFEHTPFLEWVRESRARAVRARIVGGLAGPAGIATLFRFAMRCGVGPSIRALGARPTSLTKLIGDHGPEKVMRGLAAAYRGDRADFDGIHLFCFGGYLRTCEWLHAVARGRFTLNDHSGFSVKTSH